MQCGFRSPNANLDSQGAYARVVDRYVRGGDGGGVGKIIKYGGMSNDRSSDKI